MPAVGRGLHVGHRRVPVGAVLFGKPTSLSVCLYERASMNFSTYEFVNVCVHVHQFVSILGLKAGINLQIAFSPFKFQKKILRIYPFF